MKQPKTIEKPNLTSKSQFTFDDYVAICIFTLYVLVDFVPTFSSYTFADSQWLYINILNLLVTIYVISNKNLIENFNSKLFYKSKVFILYGLFILISGISIFGALNADEGIVTLTRYFVVICSLFLIFVLFKNRNHTFLTLASIVSVLIFVECFNWIKVFFENYGKLTLNEIRTKISHHHDNKNIFSSNILIKIPFIIFCFLQHKELKKIFFGIVFFFSVVTLLFLGTRSILAGLVVSVFLTILFLLYSNVKSKTISINWKSIVFPIILLSASYVFYTFLINASEKSLNLKNAIVSTASTTTVAPISFNQSSLDIRFNYWNAAIESISENPILGCGLGNWKIASQQYENKWNYLSQNSVHTHNDFLQIAAETGILNGILFICFCGLILFLNLKTIIKSKIQDQVLFSVMILTSFVGFLIDSFFNFPNSRPTIQVIFAILVVFTILNQNSEKTAILDSNVLKTNKMCLIILLFLSTLTIYPNYLIFQFYKAIDISKADNRALNLSYNQIDEMFGNFPSIDETGTPVLDLKINYLLKENKLNEALSTINKSIKLNPYSLYANSLRVDLYNKTQQYDSAYKYAKKVYDLKPNYQVYFERYVQSAARIKDTTSIIKAFENLNQNAMNPQHFITTFGCLLKAGYNKTKSFDHIKKGLVLYPNDESLLKISNDFNATTSSLKSNLSEKELQIKASKTNNYNEIEQFYLSKYATNNKDFAMIENLGICYFQQKKYKLAIRYLKEVVNSKTFQNGKSEYVMAVSYSNLGNKKMACEMANMAFSKNYFDAKTIIQNNCK